MLIFGDMLCLLGIIAVALILGAKLIAVGFELEFKLFKFFIRLAIAVFCLGGLSLFVGRLF